MNKISLSPSLSQVAHPTLANPYVITAAQQGAAPDRLQLRSLVPRSLRFRRRVSLVVSLVRVALRRLKQENGKVKIMEAQ